MKDLANIRRQYGDLKLSEASIETNPFLQFKKWFSEILSLKTADPTAMVLSTTDESGLPDSRVVLLKSLENDRFIFFTGYESNKAKQLQANPAAALNFYWPELSRQVRVRGIVSKLEAKLSDEYFTQRPRESQISTLVSIQSQEIPNRLYLEDKFLELEQQLHDKTIKRPSNWGGYSLIASELEFWQGRDNRLHDRIQFSKTDSSWTYRRLAP